jgi:hypothetical protein
LGVELDNALVLAKVCLVGGEESGIMEIAKSFECGQRRFDHGDVFGAEDRVKDIENVWGNEDDIFV